MTCPVLQALADAADGAGWLSDELRAAVAAAGGGAGCTARAEAAVAAALELPMAGQALACRNRAVASLARTVVPGVDHGLACFDAARSAGQEVASAFALHDDAAALVALIEELVAP